jgi:ATP-dependent RNA helicase DDX27
MSLRWLVCGKCFFLGEFPFRNFFLKVFLHFLLGGLSLKQQETELRARPDIVIATPGRLIDHVRNSPTFLLESIEILVIDEADR